MDKDTFLAQLALLMSHGPVGVRKVGRTFLLESADTARHPRHPMHPMRVSIPQSVVPWLQEMVQRARQA